LSKADRGFVARQCRASGDFSDDRFEVVHRLLSGLAQLIGAGDLREGGLIDSGTDVSFPSFVTYCATSSSVNPR